MRINIKTRYLVIGFIAILSVGLLIAGSILYKKPKTKWVTISE